MITDDTESAEINVVYVADRIVQGEALCVAKIVCNVTLTSGIGGGHKILHGDFFLQR